MISFQISSRRSSSYLSHQFFPTDQTAAESWFPSKDSAHLGWEMKTLKKERNKTKDNFGAKHYVHNGSHTFYCCALIGNKTNMMETHCWERLKGLNCTRSWGGKQELPSFLLSDSPSTNPGRTSTHIIVFAHGRVPERGSTLGRRSLDDATV